MPNNHRITLAKAIEMTQTYRNNRQGILKPEYAGKDVLPLSETFDKSMFASLMGNEKVKSIRIYYGMDKDLKVHAILVGADKDNKDILPDNIQAKDGDGDDGEIFEDGIRCPTYCPPASVLNEP